MTELEAANEDRGDGLVLRELDLQFELGDVYTDRPPVITVPVDRPPGERLPPDAADDVRARLEAATDGPLEGTVEAVETQHSG